MPEKPLVWAGTSRSDVASFPVPVRREAGHDLWLVQAGREPRDWRPMPDIGRGVVEVRVHVGMEYRVFYVATFPEAVYVLHAFVKKTRRAARRDIDTGRRRYAQVVAARARRRPGG
jgi:phage-related protein